MAPKDYVARGRTKQNVPPPKPSLPWLRIIITLSFVVGFATFLWSIKDNAEKVKVKEPQLQGLEEKDPLPKVPEEEWEFINTLPEYTVEIDSEQLELSDRRYLMQCGSFRSDSQANEMKATIAFQGLEAQVRASDGKNGRWYRVILGPYDSKRAAEKHRHTLKRGNINGCQIWYWNL